VYCYKFSDIFAAFTHAGLTIRHRTKRMFVFCQGHILYSLWRG